MDIFKGVDIVAFDFLGVILTKGDFLGQGLCPIYGGKFSEKYIAELYDNIRTNPAGDSVLWTGLSEKNPEIARKKLLDSYIVDSDLEDFISFLDEKKIDKGILSNMPKEWGEYFEEKFVLKKTFNPLIFSGYIGFKKPNLDIFQEFIKTSSYKPENILFIDDIRDNLQTAHELNMKTVLFDRGWKVGDFEPDLVIKGFRELI